MMLLFLLLFLFNYSGSSCTVITNTKHEEFRGLWLATVVNVDWPSAPAQSTKQQQKQLMDYINMMQELKMNALIFQIRPAGDTFYQSKLEPWSKYLTGQQGLSPNPIWDPLEFAVTECHKRHIEVHAWFNPYRAKVNSNSFDGLASNHMANRFRQYAYPYGDYIWMDPAAEGVQNHTYDVIMDVISRYDVDGVHWDDYFYPYPVKGQEFPDNATYNSYKESGGKLNCSDWRRNNVNTFIQRVYQGIKQKRRTVKFGIAPFGLYKPGKPEGMPSPITGFDPYEETYADAKLWLREGWVDYLTPGIFFKIKPPQQSYPVVLKWWLSQNSMRRHVYPGNAAYKIQQNANWKVTEIMNQIDITRSLQGKLALGNVMFSGSVFKHNLKNISSVIRSTVYQYPAKIPFMPWLHN